jgi:hypothetical protein
VAELAFYIFAREVYETIPGVRELKHSAVMKIRQQKWDGLSAAKKLVFEERAEAQVAEGEEEDRLLDIKLSMNFSAFAEFPIEAWWAALRRVRINSRSPHMPIKPRDKPNPFRAFADGDQEVNLEEACSFADAGADLEEVVLFFANLALAEKDGRKPLDITVAILEQHGFHPVHDEGVYFLLPPPGEGAVDYFALPLLNYQQFQANARDAHDVPHPDDDFSQGATLQELEDEYGGYDSEGNHTGEYDTYETAPTKPAPTQTPTVADEVGKDAGAKNANGGFSFGTAPVVFMVTPTISPEIATNAPNAGENSASDRPHRQTTKKSNQ